MSTPLTGACIFGQSGGPTSVINSSACGVFEAALKSPYITKVYGAAHGIKGVLNDQLLYRRLRRIPRSWHCSPTPPPLPWDPSAIS